MTILKPNQRWRVQTLPGYTGETWDFTLSHSMSSTMWFIENHAHPGFGNYAWLCWWMDAEENPLSSYHMIFLCESDHEQP